jgi:cytochrome P450
MAAAVSHVHQLGEESSVWFKLTPLLKGPNNPLTILMTMADRYGGVIPVNMANQRVVLLTEPDHFKRVLVTKADDYIKYFDGLKPIFGKSMITHDGVLWQKIRMPQQPAFHPDMFAEYIPYFLSAIRTKMDIWAKLAQTGETFEMVEQTWTLAADMICKALFDREMPFNPHFVFKCVKTYTDVMNHKSIRLKKVAGEEFEITEENAAKAMEVWAGVPPEVIAADPREDEMTYGDREPTAADYSALAYTRAVIQETMRLYPPIWMLVRVAAKPDTIDGKEIRVGDKVALFAYGAHHSPKFWSDPEAFMPERWLGDAAKKRKPYTYLPFGGGKRSCIGGAMSQVENVLALSILLRRFRPEYVGPEPPGINATVTLTPKGGLPFKIRNLS